MSGGVWQCTERKLEILGKRKKKLLKCGLEKGGWSELRKQGEKKEQEKKGDVRNQPDKKVELA